MSNEKSTSQVTIIVAIIGLVGTLGGALFANWDKIFPNPNPNLTPTTSETSSPPIESPSAQTPDTTSIDVDRLIGRWSSEGNIQATHLMQLEINREDRGLTGVLKANSYNDNGSSGILSILSETEGEVVTVEIFDQKGYEVGEAELSRDGEVLVWRLIRAQGMAETTLPSISYLYSVDELNF